MPVWLQFVAAHRIILWLALIYGLLILILSTALYSRAVEITECDCPSGLSVWVSYREARGIGSSGKTAFVPGCGEC